MLREVAPKLAELTDAIRPCMGTPGTVQTGAQSRDGQRADRDVSPRAASVSPRQSPRERRDQRTRRSLALSPDQAVAGRGGADSIRAKSRDTERRRDEASPQWPRRGLHNLSQLSI